MITIPNMHQEITVDIVAREVSIRAPHSLIGGKAEGLCGEDFKNKYDYILKLASIQFKYCKGQL